MCANQNFLDQETLIRESCYLPPNASEKFKDFDHRSSICLNCGLALLKKEISKGICDCCEKKGINQ